MFKKRQSSAWIIEINTMLKASRRNQEGSQKRRKKNRSENKRNTIVERGKEGKGLRKGGGSRD